MDMPGEVIRFLEKQNIMIVSTLDNDGNIHCSVKGMISVEEDGRVFIIDLYKSLTYKNLTVTPRVSLTAVNEHDFMGYTLQGKARIISHPDIGEHIVKKWEDRITKRISDRMIRSVHTGIKSKTHHEAALPQQHQYLIEVDIDNIIDLAPPELRKRRGGS